MPRYKIKTDIFIIVDADDEDEAFDDADAEVKMSDFEGSGYYEVEEVLG